MYINPGSGEDVDLWLPFHSLPQSALGLRPVLFHRQREGASLMGLSARKPPPMFWHSWVRETNWRRFPKR